MHTPALALAFSLFVLCFVTCSISGIVLFFFKAKQINARLKHPYLEHRAFNQYPLAIQAAIMLDYFFRLMFPGTRFWLVGNANRLLAHVDPKQVPLSLKWPGGLLGRLLARADRHDRPVDPAVPGNVTPCES